MCTFCVQNTFTPFADDWRVIFILFQYSRTFITQVGRDDENDGRADDLITLSTLGLTTHWRWPKHRKRCPVAKCCLEFVKRSDAIEHYSTLHAKGSVFCSPCNKPLRISCRRDFQLHHATFHPNEINPFDLKREKHTKQIQTVCSAFIFCVFFRRMQHSSAFFSYNRISKDILQPNIQMSLCLWNASQNAIVNHDANWYNPVHLKRNKRRQGPTIAYNPEVQTSTWRKCVPHIESSARLSCVVTKLLRWMRCACTGAANIKERFSPNFVMTAIMLSYQMPPIIGKFRTVLVHRRSPIQDGSKR